MRSALSAVLTTRPLGLLNAEIRSVTCSRRTDGTDTLEEERLWHLVRGISVRQMYCSTSGARFAPLTELEK
jgi:hypothetical protein